MSTFNTKHIILTIIVSNVRPKPVETVIPIIFYMTSTSTIVSILVSRTEIDICTYYVPTNTYGPTRIPPQCVICSVLCIMYNVYDHKSTTARG